MRNTRPSLKVLALGTLVLFFLLVAAEVMARRGGGGRRGGHHMGQARHTRMGPASGGSFSSRAAPRRSVTTSRARPSVPEVGRDRPRPNPAVPPAVRHERREEIREEIRE